MILINQILSIEGPTREDCTSSLTSIVDLSLAAKLCFNL